MQNRYKNPRPMGRISYPTSDIELETWVEQTIQREIARGRMLQDQKSLSSERSNKLSVFIPKLANGRIISKSNKRGHIRSKSPLVKNAKMSSSVSRDESCSSYRSPRLGRPACSLRISELAAPTKRQCMASWRANAKVLPETMIHRLKQRVTDQEPIVKVSDAVNCLKHTRRPSDSRNSVVITPSNRPSRKIKTESMNQKLQAEYKALSDSFAIKIAELLMKPIVITLNSQLKNISNIISDDIYNIIKDTKTFKTDTANNKKMLQETSEKVTIWIAKILEDSSEKTLEEELKELEEQEGPVLDLIDDLVDSILHKCIKTPSDILTPDYLSVTSEDIDKNEQQEPDHQTIDKIASHDDVITMDEEANKNTIENDIIKQLSDVIYSVTQESGLESPRKDFDDPSTDKEEKLKENDTNSETGVQSGVKSPEINVKSEPDIDVLYSNDTPLAMPEDDNNDEHDENTNENINHTPKLMAPEENNGTDTNEEQTSNVSGVIDIITEELSEEKNKTVQFSKESLDPIKDIYKEQNNQFNSQNVHLEDAQQLEKIAYFDRPHIDFAPPNDELLSDADESWPDTIPTSKPSASVTRSITSMGRLLETDEILSNNFEDPTEHLLQTTDSNRYHVDDNDEKNEQSKLQPEEVENLREIQQTKLQPEEGNLKEIDVRETGDFQSGKEFPYNTEIGEPAHGIVSKPEIYDSNAMVSLEPAQKSSATSIRKDASLILIGDADLLDSEVHERIIDLRDTGDLQSSKESPYITEIGEPAHGIVTKPEIDDSNAMVSLVPVQKASATSIRKGASLILIGDTDLLDSEVHERTIWESDISKRTCSPSPDKLKEDATNNNNKRQIADQFISHKFDYRVHLNTAPAWIRRGQGEPNGSPCDCTPLNNPDADNMNPREREIRKRCQDLDLILKNLDKWKTWLNYISKYITDLKRKAGKVNTGRHRSPSRTEEDISWRQLQKRAMGGLEMRRQDDTVKFKIPSAPLKYCRNCGRRKPNQMKRRHHHSNTRNNIESKCKRHSRRNDAYQRKH